MTSVAIDLSGLAWDYRTGVQNLYWAFLCAYAENYRGNTRADIIFYDRSGLFNKKIFQFARDHYRPVAPAWWPERFRHSLRRLYRFRILPGPALHDRINHVWNWDIYHPRNARGSITIPDILPLEYPDWFSKPFQDVTKKSLAFAKDRAEFVFCISNYVKKRVVAITGIHPDRIKVVYPGIESRFFDKVPQDEEFAILRKYSLEKNNFLLSSGFLDPRKNLARQIEAFGIYAGRTGVPLKYALTGLKTSLSSDVLAFLEKPHLKNRVMFLGYVPQNELKILMGASAALMYCSIAEGFGLPIIEAMAAGAPVITSRTTSMMEVAAGRAALVAPDEVDDIVRAIEETVLTNGQDRRNRIEQNRDYASRFTIRNWLEGHLKAYRRD